MLLLLACQPAEPERVVPVPFDDAPPGTPDLARASREEARRLDLAFAAALAHTTELDAQTLLETQPSGYREGHGLTIEDAEYRDGFVRAFGLDEDTRAVLDDKGFVVVPVPEGAGPVDLYYRVFAADLPVFVSADSILHAWHRSYDDVLEATEQEVMHPALQRALEQLSDALDPKVPAQRDALLYVTVALELMHSPKLLPLAVQDDTRAILELLRTEQVVELPLLGNPRSFDASQLIVRGHYTHSEELGHYFRAMMWLGRLDLELFDPRKGASTYPREEAAARALAATAETSGALAQLAELDRFYAVHVGRPNALSLGDVLAACRKAGLTACVGAPEAMAPVYASAGPSGYSSALAEPGVAASPALVTMRLFPQRFAYDAWWTTKTTAPRLPAPTMKDGRTMPSPLDVAYVLGSDRALVHLAADLELPSHAALPGTLVALRGVFAALPPTALDETIYNHWLEALAVLARPDVDPALPRVLRTTAWHDRRLEATLASWAELRHDTVLIVDQPMGMIGCQYPRGYVEPVPQLYRELDDAAAHLVALYADEDSALGHSHIAGSVKRWGAHFRQRMQQLATLAEHERAHAPPTAEELAFFAHTVDRHHEGYGGSRSYDGWYPALYYDRSWGDLEIDRDGRPPHHEGGRSEPVVTDVFTDIERRLVLEVGVGRPELAIVAIDVGGEVAIYGGPVSSFYAFEQPLSERLTDDAWEERIAHGQLPPRPAFARSYRVTSR